MTDGCDIFRRRWMLLIFQNNINLIFKQKRTTFYKIHALLQHCVVHWAQKDAAEAASKKQWNTVNHTLKQGHNLIMDKSITTFDKTI